MTWVTNQSVVLQALLGGLFTWFCTIMGSAVVFFFKTVSRRLLDTMLGFAAGGIFLRLVDAWVPHLHLGNDKDKAEGGGEKDRKNLSKTALLFLAITIHNIPEGLAVGVTFGALASNYSPAAFIGAIGLAIGIGIKIFLKVQP
ncbi:divalent heavy-metal cations transporter [Streptococcus suis]|nr:divalent heavy-metal cations transporter [Streptococcus suis]CYV38281.1 divalent heavy-metal cations transporter [Streptococcus suis]